MRHARQHLHVFSTGLIIGAIVGCILIFTAGTVQAIPKMQLYIPGGQYDRCNSSWVSTSQDFEVWLIVASLDEGAVRNPILIFALGQGELPADGALTVIPQTPTPGEPYTYDAIDF
jgi:hypothetical protein